jgi:hypothetical protein
VTKAETEISEADTGQITSSKLSTPLPVIGLFGSVAIGRKMQLEGKVSVFRMDFDIYEGSLNYVYLGLQRTMGEYGSFGVGYNYYSMRLGSNDAALSGELRLQHHGPLLFLSANF